MASCPEGTRPQGSEARPQGDPPCLVQQLPAGSLGSLCLGAQRGGPAGQLPTLVRQPPLGQGVTTLGQELPLVASVWVPGLVSGTGGGGNRCQQQGVLRAPGAGPTARPQLSQSTAPSRTFGGQPVGYVLCPHFLKDLPKVTGRVQATRGEAQTLLVASRGPAGVVTVT